MAKEEAIEQALRKIDGVSKLLSRKEVKELPSLLWEDELPEALSTGRYNNGNGIVVATNKRAIFIDKGLMSLTVEDFPYDRISSIEFHTGMMMGDITIYTSGNKAEIKSIPKDQVRPFAEFLRARITSAVPHQSQQASPGGSDDHIAQLERLASLKAQGAITEQEFEAEKSKLLR